MAIENQVPDGNGQAPVQPVSDEGAPSVETLMADLENERKEKEAIKLAQQGSDKKVTELSGMIEQLQSSLKEKMTASEKTEYELRKDKEEKDLLQKKVLELSDGLAEMRSRDLKVKILNDNNLTDISLIDRFPSKTVEDFEESIRWYLAQLSDQASSVKTDMVNGSSPKGGADVQTDKQIKRSDFDALDPMKKVEAIKDGVKIID